MLPLNKLLAAKDIMYQEGDITISECTECGERFPVFIFVADTDMVTTGCVALTGKSNDIILAIQGPEESLQDIEVRAGSNHKIVGATYEASAAAQTGSFQKYLKSYQPAVPTYTCVYCGGSAKVIKHETKEQFLNYGTIEVLNGS